MFSLFKGSLGGFAFFFFFSPLKILAFPLSSSRGKHSMRTRGKKMWWVVPKDFVNLSRTWPCNDGWIIGADRPQLWDKRKRVDAGPVDAGPVAGWKSAFWGIFRVAFSALPLTVSTSVTFAWPLENSGMRCKKLNFEEVFFLILHLAVHRGLRTRVGSVT